ncbi:hypothetical protein GCM10007874_26420 [Labrys miyagiensis]|uniref:Uncharacterized protein n=1 Tax=Labrys miyagiensis TaxID=346912 RepID=A0ABQ6CHI8_9HYPH|nr:hypothetical protein [Labrys miyagiensis]GLS19625.1 hypothetical protein GCM10007874_26420 [Labrys miyagiensis]
MILPIFLQLISNPGVQQDIDPLTQAAIIAGAIALQGSYWLRYRWVTIHVPFRSAPVGHLVMFASRVSFFFGGALFSVIFFRHVPEFDMFPPLGQAMLKLLIVMAILFALFCYALELERFGKAIDDPSSGRANT